MENEGANERIYLQLYDYETKEFSGLTTYHGLVRIYNSNTWPSRIFWSVVVLSCLSLFMIHSGYLLLGYHSKPTLFQTNTIIPLNGLLFPEVTICNLNPLDMAKIQNMNLSSSTLTYILKHYNEITATQNPATTLENQQFQDFLTYYESRKGAKFDVRDFLRQTSKTCEETFVSCSFGRQKLENCCEHVETEMTETGICFRLSNKNQSYRQWYSGNGFGWELVLNGNNYFDEDLELEDYDLETGFLVMVHEGEKYPRINSYGVAVSPNSQLHAAVFMKNISLLDKANWGSCSKGWTGNETDGFPYTANHCEIDCKLKKVQNECGCSPLAYSARLSKIDIPFCSPSEIRQCFKKLKGIENRWEDDCDCPSECNMLEFDVTNSYSDLNGRSKGFTVNQVENDISHVSLYYSRVAYERIEQQKQLQTADLLSNIAGSMGLFLGMSTVTLLEIFIYLFKSVWGTVNSTRQQQFVDAVAEEEKERAQSIVIIQNGSNEEDQLRGGDLFSAPRGSVSIPPQLLSPLSKHNRQSISYGQLGRKVSAIGLPLPPTEEGGETPMPPKTTIRRCSTSTSSAMLTRKLSFASQQSDPAQPVHLNRKVSTSSIFKSQLI
uniref:Degenerin-like protein unc-105 n=1 Tax=Caenorhabditis tropicalis TaxID=1561998 RepID=A0A1I7TRJ9_9PELO